MKELKCAWTAQFGEEPCRGGSSLSDLPATLCFIPLPCQVPAQPPSHATLGPDVH